MFKSGSGFAVAVLFCLTTTCFSGEESVNQQGPIPKETCALKAAGKIEQGGQLLIEAEKRQYSPDEPINVRGVLKNLGKAPLPYPEQTPGSEFQLRATDSKGDVVPFTRYGSLQRANQMVALRDVLAYVPPSEEISVDFQANRIYDMTLAGTYKLTMKCSICKKDGTGVMELESGPLQVSVVERTVPVPAGRQTAPDK